jgi:hypothetical protein
MSFETPFALLVLAWWSGLVFHLVIHFIVKQWHVRWMTGRE